MEIFGKKIDGLLIIIGILVLTGLSWWFVSNTSAMMMKGQRSISTQVGAVDAYKYERYKTANNTSGEDIRNFINGLRYEDDKIKVNVDGIEYGWINKETYNGLDIEANDANKASYIAPNKKYSIQMIKNNNGIVTELFFTKAMIGKWKTGEFSSLIYDFEISECNVGGAQYFGLYHQGVRLGNIVSVSSKLRTSSLVFEDMVNLRVKLFSDSGGLNMLKDAKIVGNITGSEGTGILSE